eukprot:756669-Amphidinium_carterae.1
MPNQSKVAAAGCTAAPIAAVTRSVVAARIAGVTCSVVAAAIAAVGSTVVGAVGGSRCGGGGAAVIGGVA